MADSKNTDINIPDGIDCTTWSMEVKKTLLLGKTSKQKISLLESLLESQPGIAKLLVPFYKYIDIDMRKKISEFMLKNFHKKKDDCELVYGYTITSNFSNQDISVVDISKGCIIELFMYTLNECLMDYLEWVVLNATANCLACSSDIACDTNQETNSDGVNKKITRNGKQRDGADITRSRNITLFDLMIEYVRAFDLLNKTPIDHMELVPNKDVIEYLGPIVRDNAIISKQIKKKKEKNRKKKLQKKNKSQVVAANNDADMGCEKNKKSNEHQPVVHKYIPDGDRSPIVFDQYYVDTLLNEITILIFDAFDPTKIEIDLHLLDELKKLQSDLIDWAVKNETQKYLK